MKNPNKNIKRFHRNQSNGWDYNSMVISNAFIWFSIASAPRMKRADSWPAWIHSMRFRSPLLLSPVSWGLQTVDYNIQIWGGNVNWYEQPEPCYVLGHLSWRHCRLIRNVGQGFLQVDHVTCSPEKCNGISKHRLEWEMQPFGTYSQAPVAQLQ